MWRDEALLLDILLAGRDAMEFIADMERDGFLASRLHQNAVIRSLEIIGEAANKLSPEFRSLHPEIPWGEMIGLRNRLIHAYNEIQLDIVWQVITTHLPDLIGRIQPLVPPDQG